MPSSETAIKTKFLVAATWDDAVQVFEELRVYRRNDKGKVVKERDHLMDAMRYYVLACVETKFTWLQTDVASVVAPPPYRPQGVWM